MNRKWLIGIFATIFFVTGLAGFAMYKLVEDDVEAVHEGAKAGQAEEPPKSATEILAAELAGEPEAFPKATAEDIARLPADSRAEASLEDEFDSIAPSRSESENESKDDAVKKRTIASVPKKSESMFKVESSKTVVSKNLERKKALVQLRKDFSKDDCQADTGKAKSLKAVVELKKDGAIGKIKLQPSTAGDKDLIKCLKRKLTAKAKAYKSADKSGGKLTIQFKIK